MPDTIFDDLIARQKSLAVPVAPPRTAQERIAELPGQEAPKQGLLEQFIYGKLTEAAPTPGAEFENFFRSRYSPAQEFVSNFIRGAVATGKGVEASNVREESIKEFQIFQRDKQAQQQANIQMLGVVSNLMQSKAELASRENMAKDRLEFEKLREENDQTNIMHDRQSRSIMNEYLIRKGGIEAETAQKENKLLDLEIRDYAKKYPHDPIGLATSLWIQANPDKSPATPEAQAEMQKSAKLWAKTQQPEKAAAPPAPLPEAIQAYENIFVQTGDMKSLEKLPEAVQEQVLINVAKTHKITGYADPKFVAKVAPALAASSALDDFNAIVIDAKKSHGKPNLGLVERILGAQSRLEGLLGTDTSSGLVSKLAGITGITTAKGFGELRTTDSDAKIAAKVAATPSSTWAEIEELIKFQKRRFYGNIVTQTRLSLVQPGGPAPAAGKKRFEEMDEHLAETNRLRQARGAQPLNIVDYTRLAMEKGWSFE